MKKNTLLLIFGLSIFACQNTDESTVSSTYTDVQIAGAMRQVMWEGQLAGLINLDTIQPKVGLYGLGPEAFLKGELLINNGKILVSRVLKDSSMTVAVQPDLEAPFFVYGQVNEWEQLDLPPSVTDISSLEQFINEKTASYKRPFVFKLKGKAVSAKIHVQNLPEGSQVSSPKEAHQGQVDYFIKGEPVEIIGFFSTEHKGVFTHHDSYLHMHLITADGQKMGHLDNLAIKEGQMQLYLPVR